MNFDGFFAAASRRLAAFALALGLRYIRFGAEEDSPDLQSVPKASTILSGRGTAVPQSPPASDPASEPVPPALVDEELGEVVLAQPVRKRAPAGMA